MRVRTQGIRWFAASTLLILLSGNAARADDIELYLGANNINAQANVLFILDTSGSMQWNIAGKIINEDDDDLTNDGPSRLEIVQQVTNGLLDQLEGVNVGLMRFDSGSGTFDNLGNYVAGGGGSVQHAMEDVVAARQSMMDKVTELDANGHTPLTEALYEAGMYYMGKPVDYGVTAIRRFDPDDPIPSVAESHTGSGGAQEGDVYISPMGVCQKNFVVFLTDGAPQYDNSADAHIEALRDEAGMPTGCDTGQWGTCLDDMAEYLYENDLLPEDVAEGTQNVVTHTVGFAIDLPLLEETANKGGGLYRTANNAEELTEALLDILTEIQDVDSTFAAPAVTVNAFERTSYLNQLYFTVFKPSDTAHWQGNLKKYELGFENPNAPPGSQLEILDSQGNLAVDPETGFFFNGEEGAYKAWSFWSDAPDGAEIAAGGAAMELRFPRKVYTYPGSGSLTLSAHDLGDTGTIETIKERLIELDPGGLVSAEPDPEAYLDDVLAWADGIDVKDEDEDLETDDERQMMGDPLHMRPLTIVYGEQANGEPEVVVFVGTNEGVLHAIDGTDGSERFTFLPEPMWAKLPELFNNRGGKTYGLDGPITSWIDDGGDGSIDPGAGDHAYIYFGLRRGGSYYLALDVTDPDNPRYLWSITNPDTNPDDDYSVTSGFEQLAQTWSAARYGRVKIGNDERRDVLFIGGGYDEQQDDLTAYADDALGNAVYIVDALSGELLWSASGEGGDLTLSDMRSSIPADLRIIDTDIDGLIDRAYVGDMGGRVWRFDFLNGNVASDFGGGGAIASVGGAAAPGSEVDNRRFYYAPDVALIQNEFSSYFNLAIGSGYRAHPVETAVQDRFYAIRDPIVFGAPANLDYDIGVYNIVEGSLVDITAGDLEVPLDAKGWLLRLEEGEIGGEKVLAEATTFQEQIFFTTFLPGLPSGADCAGLGTGLLYAVAAEDADAVLNLDGEGDDDDLTPDDRSGDLDRPGIPPEVVIFIPGQDDYDLGDGDEDCDPNVEDCGCDPAEQDCDIDPPCIIGTESIECNLDVRPTRTFWRQHDVTNN